MGNKDWKSVIQVWWRSVPALPPTLDTDFGQSIFMSSIAMTVQRLLSWQELWISQALCWILPVLSIFVSLYEVYSMFQFGRFAEPFCMQLSYNFWLWSQTSLNPSSPLFVPVWINLFYFSWMVFWNSILCLNTLAFLYRQDDFVALYSWK